MSEERRTGEVPIPGIRAVQSILQFAPHRMRRIQFSGPDKGQRARLLEQARAHSIPVREVSNKTLDGYLEGTRHQGIFGFATPAQYVDWDSLCAHPDALLVAADQVTDPRNLGAILRASEAMGAHGALLTRNRCARLGPTVARTSAGASELLPVAMETNLARSLRAAKNRGVVVVGADLEGTAPAALDLAVPVIIVIGAEGRGLRPSTRKVCDHIASIPLSGMTESLNAATAAGILVYEAQRQRREKGNELCAEMS